MEKFDSINLRKINPDLEKWKNDQECIVKVWPFAFKLAAGLPKPYQVRPFLDEQGFEFNQSFYTFRFKTEIELIRAMDALKKEFKNVPLLD